MKQLRFGFHDFLNAQPLLIPLTQLASQGGFRIILDNPAVVAEKLDSGELDLAMIPSVEYLRNADRYLLLPNFAIASRGPVSTVLLAAKKPLDQIRSVAIDNRSKTSAALLRILFAEAFPSDIRYQPASPDAEAMLAAHDAALVIGDQAFKIGDLTSGGITVCDLSEEWFKRTGKAFVHAVVAVRSKLKLSADIIEVLRKAKVEAHRTIQRIANTQSHRIGISSKICEDYLKNKIIYDFGENEMAGLTRFRDLCVERGLIEQPHPLRFVEYA